jgi:tetratricopeptide (TPR) repeat protein
MTVGAMQASANLAYDEARYKEARGLADHIRQVQENTLGPDHTALVGSWIFAARLDIADGQLDAAGAAIDRAAAIAAKSLPPGHPFNIDVLEGKADVAAGRGDLVGVERYDREALALADKLFGQDHPIHTAAADRVVSILWISGKRAEVEKIRRNELTNVQQKLGDNNPDTARAMRNLAAVFANSGRIDGAVSLYRRALKIDEQAFGPLSREVARDDLALASTLIVVGEFDEAQTALKRTRSVSDKQGDLLLVSATLDQMARLAAMRLDSFEGLIHTEAMFNAVEQCFGAGSPILVPSLAQLGRFYLLTGRMNEAKQVMERITGLIGNDPPEQSPGFWSYLQFRAMLFADQDDIGQAEATFKKALSVAAKYGGSEAIEVAFTELNLAITYL